MKKRHPLTVGRGPVPRHRPCNPMLAGDRPPRGGEKTACVPVGLGPSHATRACERVSLAIVRTPGPVSQDRLILTYSGETHIGTMEFAGDRPPRYGHIETGRSRLPVCIEPRGLSYRPWIACRLSREATSSETAFVQSTSATLCRLISATSTNGFKRE